MDKRGLLGQRIRTLRRAKNLSQEFLAGRIGTNPKYLSRIELGKENPSYEFLLKIAKSLDIHPSKLFPDRDGTPQALRKEIERIIANAKDEDLPRILSMLEILLP